MLNPLVGEKLNVTAQTMPCLRLKTRFTANHFAVFTNIQFLLTKGDNFIDIAKNELKTEQKEYYN